MKDYLRIGKVSSINYKSGTARVTYEDKDNSTTAEMSFLAWEYWMPQIGDQVLVAHLSSGTCAGVIVGPVWHNGHRPFEGFDGLYRKEYANEDGVASERYDAKGKSYTLSITGGIEIAATEDLTISDGAGATIQMDGQGNIVIATSGTITINAPSVRVMGTLTVDKAITAKSSLTVSGNITGKKGIKATEDIETEANISAALDITADGNITATGNVKGGSVTLNTHTHTSADPGSSTSGPK